MTQKEEEKPNKTNKTSGAGETARHLGALGILADDLNLVSSTERKAGSNPRLLLQGT